MPKTESSSVREVAKRAGVSTATVSRALNSPQTVAPRTLERVLGIAEHLGYKPNILGRNLVTGRTHLVGLVVPDIGTTLYGEIAKGIEDALMGTGLQVVLASTRDNPELERSAVENLLHHSVDTGIVINSRLQPRDSAHRDWIHISPESPEYPLRVELDNYLGARLAVRHLLESGRRDIVHLAGTLREGLEREQGWRDELSAWSLEPKRRFQGDYTRESGARCARVLLAEGLPDAVFASGDLMAASALQTFQAAGVRVPADVALIGFDDAAYTCLLHPTLTTVRQPAYLMGQKAAELALRKIEGETPEPVTFAPELVVRGSTGIPEEASRGRD